MTQSYGSLITSSPRSFWLLPKYPRLAASFSIAQDCAAHDSEGQAGSTDQTSADQYPPPGYRPCILETGATCRLLFSEWYHRYRRGLLSVELRTLGQVLMSFQDHSGGANAQAHNLGHRIALVLGGWLSRHAHLDHLVSGIELGPVRFYYQKITLRDSDAVPANLSQGY